MVTSLVFSCSVESLIFNVSHERQEEIMLISDPLCFTVFPISLDFSLTLFFFSPLIFHIDMVSEFTKLLNML